MPGKNIYKSTFDEIQIPEYMFMKLMMLNGQNLIYERSNGFLYRIVTGIITFIGVMAASGALFSVPLG